MIKNPDRMPWRAHTLTYKMGIYQLFGQVTKETITSIAGIQ